MGSGKAAIMIVMPIEDGHPAQLLRLHIANLLDPDRVTTSCPVLIPADGPGPDRQPRVTCPIGP